MMVGTSFWVIWGSLFVLFFGGGIGIIVYAKVREGRSVRSCLLRSLRGEGGNIIPWVAPVWLGFLSRLFCGIGGLCLGVVLAELLLFFNV